MAVNSDFREMGIYRITCQATGWVYIGSAMTSFRARFRAHRSTLEARKHHNPEIQSDWERFGLASFEFAIVEVVPVQRHFSHVVFARERHWIRWYANQAPIYNRCCIAKSARPEEVVRVPDPALRPEGVEA